MSVISYLITCSTETETLNRLLCKIVNILGGDQLVILQDSSSTSPYVKRLINDVLNNRSIVTYEHPLANDYGAHKNFGIKKCNGDFIFQLDGDELPPDSLLGDNLHELIHSNSDVEAYAVPRINDFRGVTPEHAKHWGWKLTISPMFNRPVVNFPDYQFRIFKKIFPRISYTRRLHEKIEGYNKYVLLPPEEEYAIYHDKTIETQVKTNLRYNIAFTQEENQGHSVFK